MDRTIELSGDSFRRLLYAFHLGGLLIILRFVVFPLDSVADAPLAFLLGLLCLALTWGLLADTDKPAYLDTGYDLTYDPFADPGQAAKDRWKQAVRRLPDGDDEQE